MSQIIFFIFNSKVDALPAPCEPNIHSLSAAINVTALAANEGFGTVHNLEVPSANCSDNDFSQSK